MSTHLRALTNPIGVMCVCSLVTALVLLPASGSSQTISGNKAPVNKELTSITQKLINSTQGPLWPPSETVDKDGNFILVGQGLIKTASGIVVPVPNQALLVSKDTVPPLDSNGKEDFTNPLAAPYNVIRELDLSPESPDLNLELYTISFGPFAGDFGGGQRIPAVGESPYNLNMARPSCLEVFPTMSQKFTYTRPSFPLHMAPINGFQGDQIAYNVEDGEPIDPHTSSGPGCGEGCSGENTADQRRDTPITLGEWLKAKGKVTIKLTRFNRDINAYTAARFNFKFTNLLPNSVYTNWAVRQNAIMPPPEERLPTPLGTSNAFVTDGKGNAAVSVEVQNPFPDPATDEQGLRVMVLAVVFHSDYQNWGSCPAHFGPGVDVHQVFNTPIEGNFITKKAP